MSMNLTLSSKSGCVFNLRKTPTDVTLEAIENPGQALEVYTRWIRSYEDVDDYQSNDYHLERLNNYITNHPDAEWGMI